jgi:hypothetical protein
MQAQPVRTLPESVFEPFAHRSFAYVWRLPKPHRTFHLARGPRASITI